MGNENHWWSWEYIPSDISGALFALTMSIGKVRLTLGVRLVHKSLQFSWHKCPTHSLNPVLRLVQYINATWVFLNTIKVRLSNNFNI